MKPQHQRLVLIALAAVAVLAAVLLAMSAMGDRAAYFYSPADAARDRVAPGRAMRLGGMVKTGSIVRAPDGVTITFVITDGVEGTPVRFRGIAPDLFREGSGVVAEGAFDTNGTFAADNILAKHDERYMPPELAGDRHKSESIQR